jgi:hypothetical protein
MGRWPEHVLVLARGDGLIDEPELLHQAIVANAAHDHADAASQS